MEPKGTFGPRLRQERERRQISLASIAANTKISQALLEGLERDDVSKWPSGIFRRAFVRSYAKAVGLDADEIVKEFAERFPEPGLPFEEVPGETVPASPPPVIVAPVVVTPPPRAIRHEPDYVDLVFRVSVPRSLVLTVSRLTSLARFAPRRQHT